VVGAAVATIEEGADLAFEISRELVVFEQDSVLQRLVPTLDLALGPPWVRRATDIAHAVVFAPFNQVTRDMGRAAVVERPGFMDCLGVVAA